ncbi:MAG: hypothetical protein U1E70_28850, partial [Acetobacteraceae bacterium]
FGLALVLPFALEAVVANPAARWRTAGGWGLFLSGAVAAAMLTPYGWHGLVLPVRLMLLQHLGAIGEWRSMDFSVPQPLEIALLALLYACLTRGVRIPPIRLLLLFGLLHMALQHSRHQMLAGLVGALVVAEPLAAGLGVRADARAAGGRGAVPALAGAASLLVMTALRLGIPAPIPDGPTFPVAALAQVPPDLRVRPVFNDYGFGGALMFEGVRPFIDARAELYGDEALADYLRIVRPDAAAFDDALRRNGIDWTILPPGSSLVPLLDGRPGWRRWYADRFAVLHARDGLGEQP